MSPSPSTSPRIPIGAVRERCDYLLGSTVRLRRSHTRRSCHRRRTPRHVHIAVMVQIRRVHRPGARDRRRDDLLWSNLPCPSVFLYHAISCQSRDAARTSMSPSPSRSAAYTDSALCSFGALVDVTCWGEATQAVRFSYHAILWSEEGRGGTSITRRRRPRPPRIQTEPRTRHSQ